MAERSYIDTLSEATVTATWCDLTDLIPTDTPFTTHAAAVLLSRSTGLGFTAARNRVDISLKRVLREGSPDLIRRPDRRWVLPGGHPDERAINGLDAEGPAPDDGEPLEGWGRG